MADVLGANKPQLSGTFPVAPATHHCGVVDVGAVFVALIIRLILSPLREVPNSAVCPKPVLLPGLVRRSDPDLALLLLPQEVMDPLAGDRGQVGAFLLAVLFRLAPSCHLLAPEVAAMAVLLPTRGAGRHAVV